jgi:hypothetical protein
LDLRPFDWPALRVWPLVLMLAGFFLVRSVAAALWRAWQRHRSATRQQPEASPERQP